MKHFSLLLLLSLTLVYCKKDNPATKKKGSNSWDINVSDAKKFFELALVSNTDAAERSSTKSGNIIPDWTNVYESGNEQNLYIEVPVALKTKLVPVFRKKDENQAKRKVESEIDFSFQTLAVFKSARNAYRHRIITYVGSKSYLERHNNNISHNRLGKLDKDFEGYIHYSNIYGVHIYSLRIENGKPARKIRKHGVKSNQRIVARTTSGYYDCYEDCTDWYQWGCIEFTYDHNSNGEPLQIEVCGWQYIHTNCTTECTWIGDDDPCADPQNPSPDCFGEPEPCWDCEDHNDDGIEEEPAPVPQPSDDPCIQRQLINHLRELTVIKQQNEALQLKTTAPKEYGTEQILRNWRNSSINFVEKGIRQGLNTKIDPEFSWNAMDGYTIGFSHSHNNNTGPSPDDIFVLVDALQHTDLAADGYDAINYFKKNVHTTVVTSTHTYVVFVKSWAGLATFAQNWDSNPEEMLENFVTLYNDYNENYERALLEMFGQYITLFKAINNPSSAESPLFERLTLNENQEVVNNPCP